jgi:hypothetical protein
MWSWKRKKPNPEGFPERFKVQRIGITAAMAISELPASEIAKYFGEHPEIAGALVGESYDKRFRRLSSRRKVTSLGLVGLQEMRNTSPFRSSPLWQMRRLTIFCSRLAKVDGARTSDHHLD